MKARVPKGYESSGPGNMQQLARQAQKMQDDMDAATAELEEREYKATVGGGQVAVTVTGKMEVKDLSINPEVVDPEDIEMLSDLVIAAVNEALRNAQKDKDNTLEKISGGLNIPGLF